MMAKRNGSSLSSAEILKCLDNDENQHSDSSDFIHSNIQESEMVFDIDELLQMDSENIETTLHVNQFTSEGSESLADRYLTTNNDEAQNLFQNYDSDCEIEVPIVSITNENSKSTYVSNSLKHMRRPTHKGGRQRDPVWNCFDLISLSKTQKKAVCKTCGECVTWAKIERLKMHLQKCRNKSNDLEIIGPEAKRKKMQWKLPNLLDQMKLQNQSLDLQVARFIYSSNIPFSIVSKQEFVKLIKMVKPSYTLPSEEVIGSRLLDQVYAEVTDTAKVSSKGKFVTIMQDGWTASQSAPVISHCMSIECNQMQFLNAIACETSKKTSEYCLELLKNAIQLAKENYGSRVFAVVTDNTNGMILMRKLLATDHPDIWTYGCHTHLLNLIGKKITDTDTLDKVMKVQNFFKGHTYPRETLKKLNALTPVLPAATRWNSQCDCFQNYITNHSIYIEVSKHERCETPASIMDILMNYSLFKTVEETLQNLKPISEAIIKLQHQRATVAYAIKFWIKILKDCTIPSSYKAYFDKIIDLAMTDTGCAAYLLHPKYKGDDLPDVFLKRGYSFLEKINPQFVAVAVKLRQSDNTFFPTTFMNKNLLEGDCRLQPEQWWKEVANQLKDKLPDGFEELAEKCMLMPASSSGIERIFSTLGRIMTDTRSRIGIEKAAKLCMIYKALNEDNSSSN